LLWLAAYDPAPPILVYCYGANAFQRTQSGNSIEGRLAPCAIHPESADLRPVVLIGDHRKENVLMRRQEPLSA
jgi:hypothetical protein